MCLLFYFDLLFLSVMKTNAAQRILLPAGWRKFAVSVQFLLAPLREAYTPMRGDVILHRHTKPTKAEASDGLGFRFCGIVGSSIRWLARRIVLDCPSARE